jgi:hypothetical protein
VNPLAKIALWVIGVVVGLIALFFIFGWVSSLLPSSF